MSRIKAHTPASNNHHSNNHQSFVQQTALTAGQKSAKKDNQSESETTSDIQSQVELNPSPFDVPFRGEPFVRQTVFGQPKLNIGKPNDKYEVEADRVADQVVAKSQTEAPKANVASPPVQKKDSDGPEESEGVAEKPVQMMEASEKEAQIQEKPISESITTGIQLNPIAPTDESEVQKKEEDTEGETEVQAKLDASTDTSQKIQKVAATDEESNDLQKKNESSAGGGNDVESSLKSSKGKGSAMDDNTRSSMESGFGADFRGVRIHTDSNAVQMNKSLGSQAFANGSDVYFNEGKYNPSSKDGQHLLAHELTHTVQQGASGKMVQKKDKSTVNEDKQSAEKNTNDVLAEEGGSDISINNPPKVDADAEKPDNSEKNTKGAESRSKEVMPDKDRNAEAGPEIEKSADKVTADSEKTPDEPGTEQKKVEAKKKKKQSPKEKAAVEAKKAFARADAMQGPTAIKPSKTPKVEVPVNSVGTPIDFPPESLMKFGLFIKRAELLRQKGYSLRLRALEQKIAAEQLKGNIYLMLETIFENAEALEKQKGAQEARFAIVERSKEFQKVTVERTEKSVADSPVINEKTSKLVDDTVPIADEAKEIRQEQSDKSGGVDDPDARKSEEENAGYLEETETTTSDLSSNAANMQADSEVIKAQLPTAQTDNTNSELSIQNTERQLTEMDSKFAEIEGTNGAAVSRLEELLAMPETMLAEAKRLDRKANILIEKSEYIETKVHETQSKYMTNMANVPENTSESIQSKEDNSIIQRQTEDGKDETIVQQQNDPDNIDTLSPEEQLIQQNNLTLEEQLAEIENLLEVNDADAEQTDGLLGALEDVAVSAYDDVTNVPWVEIPDMMKQEIENAVNDPGNFFMNTLEMVNSYFVPRERMPGEPLARYAVSVMARAVTGLAVTLGLVAGALGLGLILIALLTPFFFPMVAPSWPFVPWMTSTMGITGSWALFFMEIALALRVSILLNDVILRSFASSAEEQAQWTAMIEENINGIWEPLMVVLPVKFFNKFNKPRKKTGGGNDKKKSDGVETDKKKTQSEKKEPVKETNDALQGDEQLDTKAHQDTKNTINENEQVLTDDLKDVESTRKERERNDIEKDPEGKLIDSEEIKTVEEKQFDSEKEVIKDEKDLEKLKEGVEEENLNENNNELDNADGQDDTKAEANLENKEGSLENINHQKRRLPEGAKIEQLDPNTFAFIDEKIKKAVGIVEIDSNGILSFAIFRKGLNTIFSGKQAFTALIENLRLKGIDIKGIKGLWNQASDNTKMFNDFLESLNKDSFSLTDFNQAAFSTWTGNLSKLENFHSVRIDKLFPENGPPFTIINVTFY